MIDFDKLRQFYKFTKAITLKDAQVLINASKAITVKKKDILIHQGELKKDVYYIRQGLLRCYHVNNKGEAITFSLLAEYNVVTNFDVILFNRPSGYYFEALEDCKLYAINYDVLQDIVSKHPNLEANRKFVLHKIMKQTFERIESFVLLTPEERYLKFVKENPTLINRVQDKYIANVLGITPVSLSRIRKRIAQKK